LGCYGDPQAITPNLDKLASQGALYTNAFSVAGVCAPSRSALITGMYPTTIGTHHMRCRGVPPEYVKCFPEYLRAVGYYCTNNSKTDYNFKAPITAWDECSNKAHWRKRPDKKQPFFSVFNITTTHESVIRAEDRHFAELTKTLKPEERHDRAKAQLPPYYPDTPETRKDWTNYYDLITVMDKQVAELLKQLEEDGLADNTIVFFYGDHGRGLPRAKRWLYDSGIRVPLIIRWPGKIKPGEVRDELVSFVDFGPTVLSLANVDIPKYMQGKAFLGEQKIKKPRRYIFGARDRMDETYDIIRCVRDKQYKYLRNFEPYKTYAQHIDYMDQMPTMKIMRKLHAEGKLVGPQKLFFRKTKPKEELYDITVDPHEINNLADSPKHQKVLVRMRKTLEKWMKDTHDLGLIPEAELMEKVRPGGVWSVTAPPLVSLDGFQSDGSAVIKVNCPTKGASIGYTDQAGQWVRWLLYTDSITLKPDKSVRIKACRLGYKDSQEVRVTWKSVASKGQKLEVVLVEEQKTKHPKKKAKQKFK